MPHMQPISLMLRTPCPRCISCALWAGFAPQAWRSSKALTFVANMQAPLGEIAQDALTASFQMLWGKAPSELTAEDWAEFQRLCQPESPDFILILPDYYAFITYTLFYGRVPDLRWLPKVLP